MNPNDGMLFELWAITAGGAWAAPSLRRQGVDHPARWAGVIAIQLLRRGLQSHPGRHRDRNIVIATILIVVLLPRPGNSTARWPRGTEGMTDQTPASAPDGIVNEVFPGVRPARRDKLLGAARAGPCP